MEQVRHLEPAADPLVSHRRDPKTGNRAARLAGPDQVNKAGGLPLTITQLCAVGFLLIAHIRQYLSPTTD